MEDRYEIRSKIGQGGFGSVYRAFDKRMNREVAIKRINTSNDDGMLEEASRQLSKEAGALASLQHPNIITIYDVGSDEDGPYVVMELLSGSALDELVDKAPLTWDDFRELAMQTQEALISAQELDLVHRDIKPANVMLAWLPSGKFQVKLLDFGLAKLTQRPSLQTLNQADSIFGSIFFMSPEQFERAPIDRRTDMYAMGCVYYYALTGAHPFDGATAVEVMSAHLHHDFVPLDEVRPDLPKWLCDWVMWHMNRYPDDRPNSAREALQVFVQNNKYPPIEAPVAEEAPKKRPKLLIPGAEPLVPGAVAERKPEPSGQARLITKTAPQPLIPPTGIPSVHSSRQIEIEEAQKPASDTAPSPTSKPESKVDESTQKEADATANEQTGSVAEPAAAPPKKLLPQKKPTVAPPTGGVSAKPAEAATPAPAPTLIKRPTLSTPPKNPQTPNPATGTQPVVRPAVSGTQPASITKPFGANANQQPATTSGDGATEDPNATGEVPPMPTPAKQPIPDSIKYAVIGIAALLILLMGWFITDKIGQGRIQKSFNELMQLAALPETTSVPFNKQFLDHALSNAMNVSSDGQRETVFRALYLASPTDGTDIDAEIVRFVTQQEMMENVRNVLISQVLRRRANPQIVAPLLEYASKTDKNQAAAASLQAIRNLVDDSHMDSILGMIQFTKDVEVRRAAEEAAVEIINKSSNREQFASKLHGIFRSSVNDEARHAALRLSARVGDPASLELIRETLRDGNSNDKVAALGSLAAWRDDKAFPILIDFINSSDDATLIARAFASALRYATSLDEAGAETGVRRDVWNRLAASARNPQEQERLIRMLANTNSRQEPWIIPLLEKFTTTGNNSQVIDVAKRAINTIKARRAEQ